MELSSPVVTALDPPDENSGVQLRLRRRKTLNKIARGIPLDAPSRASFVAVGSVIIDRPRKVSNANVRKRIGQMGETFASDADVCRYLNSLIAGRWLRVIDADGVLMYGFGRAALGQGRRLERKFGMEPLRSPGVMA